MANNKKSNNHIGATVASIVGVTAAAVGAYYLYGTKNAKKHRAQVKSWMLKAKGDVIEKLEKAQDVTEIAYLSAVESVMDKYNNLKHIDKKEVEEFSNEMRKHWNGIKKTIKKPVKKVIKGSSNKKTNN